MSYSKLDESFAHINMYFLYGISHATAKVYLNFEGPLVKKKGMSNLTDKCMPVISIFTQIIVSFLLEKKYKCLMPCLHETRLREVNAFSQQKM